MKASIKLVESHNHPHHHHQQKENQNLLVRLKIPISILNLPFVSTITASSSSNPSDLSFNVRTNSRSGPSLKLTYSPPTTVGTTAGASAGASPLSLTLKSGVGLFGSPDNSPLILSAHFNLFSNNPNPTFSLQIHPQFGQFSLKKTAISASAGGAGDVPPERVAFHRELAEEMPPPGDGFFSGVAVSATTVLPLGRRAAVKLRWGVNFPPDFGECKSLPFLTVDKISVERVEEEVEERPVAVGKMPHEKSGVGMVGDLDAVKGMCVWIRREVEDLKKENRDLRESLEGMRLGSLRRNGQERGNSVVGSKRVSPPSNGNSGEFDRWRSRKMGREEKGGREWRERSEEGGGWW